MGDRLSIREFKLQANIGVKITAILVGLILVGGGRLFNTSSSQTDNQETSVSTTPLPDKSPLAHATPITQFNCIKLKYSYFREFYFSQNGKPLSVVFVNDIVPGKPAQIAGIQKGDIIVLVDNQPIKSKSSIQEIISTRNVGDIAEIKLVRPSSYQINSDKVQVAPPYTELEFKVPIESCSR